MRLVQVTLRRSRGEGQSLIEKWGAAIAVPRDALEAIGKVVDEHVAERFATRTDPWGNAWAPTSPVTIELRGKLGRDDSERTLARSRFTRMADKRVVVGLRSGAARSFHMGRPNNKIFGRAPAPVPARAILPLRGRRVELPSTLRDEVMTALREGMRSAVRAAGGDV